MLHIDSPPHLLLVEDNSADVQLVQYALDQTNIPVKLVHFEHGRKFLEQLPAHLNDPIACVLLDLNMPFLSGHEVLERVRQDEKTRHIPIIVFTSSTDARDVAQAYRLGANSYVRKPNELDELCRVIQHIAEFWVATNHRMS